MKQLSRPARNGFYAICDYVLPQVALLLAAPILLAHLGIAQVGIWMLASAAVSSGALLSAGFGDAAVKFIAMYRGRGDRQGVERTVRAMLAINLLLGLALSATLYVLAPFAVPRIPGLDTNLQQIGLISLRLGGALLLVKSVESVLVCTLRAAERYELAARITVTSRIAILLASVVLACMGRSAITLMAGSVAISLIAVVVQGIALRRAVGNILLLPSCHKETLRLIAGFGAFSWLQALAAFGFSHADRFVVAFWLGAPTLAIYGLCLQAAQPIHSVISAGLHALFPHLSARLENEPMATLWPAVMATRRANILAACALTIPLMIGSRLLLRLWLGNAVAQQAWVALTILALGFGLLAVNITGHYTLLALGKVRQVTFYNLAAGFAMIVAMALLTPRFGMVGAACARLVYGPMTWLIYLPLRRVHIQMLSSTCMRRPAVTP